MVLTAERNLGAKLRSAARIEPARLPRLKLLGAEWAAKLAETLRAEFETHATLDYAGAASLELPRAGDAQPSALLMMATSPGWPQPALVTLDEGFVAFAGECVLGGDGAVAHAGGRRPSELDLRLCRLLLERFLATGNAVLSPVMPTQLAAGRILAGDVAARMDELAPEDPVHFIQLAFRFTLGRLETVVCIAFPDTVLALHRRQLDRLPEPPPPPADEGWMRDIEEGLQHADMHLTALLDEKATTLGQIARFAVGQTIVLDTHVDSLITIECEEQRLFRGRMGRSRDSYLVRIEEKVDPTEEFIDDILSD